MLWVSPGWCPQLDQEISQVLPGPSALPQLMNSAAESPKSSKGHGAERNAVQNFSERHSKGDQRQEERGPWGHKGE